MIWEIAPYLLYRLLKRGREASKLLLILLLEIRVRVVHLKELGDVANVL